VNGASLDLTHDTDVRTQVAHTRTLASGTSLYIGKNSVGKWANCYIGPAAISSSRVTDAETATLSAMLTAGCTGFDLARYFRDRGYAALILPLDGDSRGYLV
jgi:hypothetical protein